MISKEERHIIATELWNTAFDGLYDESLQRALARITKSPKNVAPSPVASRKRTRKVEAYLVSDFGGSFMGSWEDPVVAFTRYARAWHCKNIRKRRRIDPGEEIRCPDNYIGTYIRRIEVVIDE